MPPDLTTARVLAESPRLGAPAEYQREILRTLLALIDAMATLSASADAATVTPSVQPVATLPEAKRGRPR